MGLGGSPAVKTHPTITNTHPPTAINDLTTNDDDDEATTATALLYEPLTLSSRPNTTK